MDTPLKILYFLFSIEKLKSLNDENLEEDCLNLAHSLKHNDNADIDGLDFK